MTSSTLSLISAVLLVTLALVFLIESRRGTRFLEPLRSINDKLVLAIDRSYVRVTLAMSHGKLRLLLHYLVHKFLQIVTKAVERLEYLLIKLQRRNRKIARTIGKRSEQNHLAEIRSHQQKTALSTAEKEDIRSKALNGE